MNAAHHLARQHIPCRDHDLKGGEGNADGIGKVPPAAGTESRREAVFEIVEFDLDGRHGGLRLRHLEPSRRTSRPALVSKPPSEFTVSLISQTEP